MTENADLKSKIQEVRSRMKRELPDGQHKLTEMVIVFFQHFRHCI